MKKIWLTSSLFCVLLLTSVHVATAMHYNFYDEQGEYVRQGNVLLGNPWYKNGGWYIGSPYLWDQLDQEECTWV